ncbi:MAG: Ada metal-binding domain-containing protein, partial [Burkholderiaceae bacterium]
MNPATDRGIDRPTEAQTRAAATLRDPRWKAVVERDAAADGSFCYSVDSTGVYCRPSCPSRRARPEHVRFHQTAAQAEAAGFRACRRCRPDQPPLPVRRAEAVAAACRLIEAADAPPALAELAAQAGMSDAHFHRLFRQATGLTPRQYAAALRERRVRDALASDAARTVIDAAFAAG